MTREYHCRRCHVRVPDSFDAGLRHVNDGFCPSCLAGRAGRQRIARAILRTLFFAMSAIVAVLVVGAFVADWRTTGAIALLFLVFAAFIWSVENA